MLILTSSPLRMDSPSRILCVLVPLLRSASTNGSFPQLTFARIKTPIRSVTCQHIGCFDADTFFMMNEQTPTWNCPICSKVLKVEDISVDG